MITITMSDRRPILIDADLWPVLCQVEWHDGQSLSQASIIRRIIVRMHADGRRIAYGFQEDVEGLAQPNTHNPKAGFLIFNGPYIEEETVRAIRRVGLDVDVTLAKKCIEDLPIEALT